jgi:hypothetical protein
MFSLILYTLEDTVDAISIAIVHGHCSAGTVKGRNSSKPPAKERV